ncbi:TMP-TENI-domain-containing protein [Xylariaceae sp. FL0016]|nr:TMP-TENI-domain-containing protein [Xylariaceae sp. FL0016]
MIKANVDYSLYLVTDSTPAILGDKDICQVVEKALKGGVTIVQYRDKTSDTGVLVETAKKLHSITSKYNVPLLINDRLDVALAVGCEGVHIGQDDLDLASARTLLGNDAIIGVTVSNAEEADAACKTGAIFGADYLGIGTVFATPTKENTKSIIGVEGLQQILIHLDKVESPVKTVCIGGINATNTSRVIWQSRTPTSRSLDGVAVVSAIMAAPDPESSSRELLKLVKIPPVFARHALSPAQQSRSPADLLALVPEVIRAIHAKKPLSHNMTNLVVQNFAANVALCVGASPIMANYGEEAADLARLGGALVVNMGTVTPDGLANHLQALRAYNDAGQPVVFDPVGAGATAVRRAATKTILNAGYIDVLKGNTSEILSCLPLPSPSTSSHPGQEPLEQRQQHGVDSTPSTLPLPYLTASLSRLANLRHATVVMTGATDYITTASSSSSSPSPNTIYTTTNGHPLLSSVTGTGCALATAISAALAAYPHDQLAATLAALLSYNIAAELTAERPDVRGPGTFVPAFLDELARVRSMTVSGDLGWLQRARLSVVVAGAGE